MFKKVKAKFMMISMIAISFVIVLIAGCTSVVSYIQMNKSNDDIIQYIMKNSSSEFPQPDEEPKDIETSESNSAEAETSQGNNPSGNMDNHPVDFDEYFGRGETYDIRYFTVTIQDDSYSANVSSISSVTEDAALTYAKTALEKNKKSGYLDSYRYNFNDGKTYVVFLLCDKDLNAYHDFMSMSLIFSAIGLVVSWSFIFVFSGVILKPVKDGYEKQKQFIANASHELKTPLTVISANNELLELTQGENQYTTTISKQIKKMNDMTKSLTALARLGENPNVDMEDVNASELLEQIVDMYTPLFEKNGKHLKADIDPDVHIKTNNEFLSQTVSIILDNACKYTQNTAEILLKIDKGAITLTQRNDVENIKDGDLTYFTERFYRDDGMRTKVAGSGIGLSIAKEITDALHYKMKIFGKDGWFNIQIKLK